MDAAKASLHAVNAELLIVEKDRRDATSKVEKCEQEVQLLKRFIDEEKVKTNQEIVIAFQKFEKIVLEKVDKFDVLIQRGAVAQKEWKYNNCNHY